MKILVGIAFILIIGSLASALVFLMRDKGRSNRTVQALALRVGFSILLFVLILVAHRLGWIQPTGIAYCLGSLLPARFVETNHAFVALHEQKAAPKCGFFMFAAFTSSRRRRTSQAKPHQQSANTTRHLQTRNVGQA
jgi:Protein of unknown function (DUF2909)